MSEARQVHRECIKLALSSEPVPARGAQSSNLQDWCKAVLTCIGLRGAEASTLLPLHTHSVASAKCIPASQDIEAVNAVALSA